MNDDQTTNGALIDIADELMELGTAAREHRPRLAVPAAACAGLLYFMARYPERVNGPMTTVLAEADQMLAELRASLACTGCSECRP